MVEVVIGSACSAGSGSLKGDRVRRNVKQHYSQFRSSTQVEVLLALFADVGSEDILRLDRGMHQPIVAGGRSEQRPSAVGRLHRIFGN